MIVGWALGASALAEPLRETRIEHAGARFRVLRAAPEQVEVMWKNDKGEAYRTFDRIQTALAVKGKKAAFLTNAGIFQMGGTPCGLHIENGATLHPLNTENAEGNFFLKPNGVVHIGKTATLTRAEITETTVFQARARQPGAPRILTAVQSGPMLLIDGKRHPAFREGSPNKLHRNGVGVDTSGLLVFAITDHGESVNLWDFAGLFLKLGCRNALFLDGDISMMSTHPEKPVESNAFGAVFVITAPDPTAHQAHGIKPK